MQLLYRQAEPAEMVEFFFLKGGHWFQSGECKCNIPLPLDFFLLLLMLIRNLACMYVYTNCCRSRSEVVTPVKTIILCAYDAFCLCIVCQNGAELLPNSTSTITTGKALFSISLGSFMPPPIRLLI